MLKTTEEARIRTLIMRVIYGKNTHFAPFLSRNCQKVLK